MRDFVVGEQFDFPQQQHRAAAGGQLRDGLFELAEFLARHHLLRDAGEGRRHGLRMGFDRSEGGDPAALELVEGEPTGRGVENGLGIQRRLILHLGEDPQVGIMRHILGLGRIAEQPGEIAPQRGHRRAIKTGKIPAAGGFVRHREPNCAQAESGIGRAGREWECGIGFHAYTS